LISDVFIFTKHRYIAVYQDHDFDDSCVLNLLYNINKCVNGRMRSVKLFIIHFYFNHNNSVFFKVIPFKCRFVLAQVNPLIWLFFSAHMSFFLILIYNYMYMFNQCFSSLNLWVRTPFMTRRTRYNILSCNWVIFCHNKWVEINYCFMMTVS
jgi:hypothetical protein